MSIPTPEPATQSTSSTSPSQEPTRQDLFSALLAGLDANASPEAKDKRKDIVCQYLQAVAAKHAVSKDYNLLVLFDESSMAKTDADNIYTAVTEFSEKKPLLLTLYSDGGSAAAAYLIGKLCREYCKDKFIVAVPRRAKSAATLLSCAADEIHMGALSELGPIDPQIDGMPALGLKNSIEHIAELTKAYPASSEMFSKYLSQSLALINLGYYERVAESAMHYAERLLHPHQKKLSKSSAEVARTLVYGYKDHGFVIDRGEALGIFGASTIKSATAEYDLGNSLYQELMTIHRVAEFADHGFYFIGSLNSAGTFTRKNKKGR